MNFLYEILGTVLSFIYNIVPNFGWAVIILTVIVRLILLPLTIKQQNSMTNMQKLQPELEKLQKKYGKDKEKLSEETMKLYKEYNVNPMGGCLPLLIQMPILIAVYGVIQRPITYLLKIKLPNGVLDALKQTAADTELNIVAFVNNNLSAAQDLLEKAKLDFDLTSLQINFDFLGINLGLTPNNPQGNYLLWAIPVVCVITSFLVSKVSQATQPKKDNKEKNSQQGQMNAMMYIFPFMTGYFCYILPAAMGIYWVAGNVLQIIQTVVLNKIMAKKLEDNLLAEENKKKK